MEENTELTDAARYYIRKRKPVNPESPQKHGYQKSLPPALVTDQNIALLESTANAYGVSIEDLSKKVKEIDGRTSAQ